MTGMYDWKDGGFIREGKMHGHMAHHCTCMNMGKCAHCRSRKKGGSVLGYPLPKGRY